MSKRIGNEDLLNQETGPVKMDAGSVAEPTEQTPSTNKPSTNQGTSEPKAPEGTKPDVPKGETPQGDIDSGKSEDLIDKSKEGNDKGNPSNKAIGEKQQGAKEPKQYGSKQIKGGDQKLSKMDGLANGDEGDKGNTLRLSRKFKRCEHC